MRKIADDLQLEGENVRLTPPVVYDRIKRSNSSLNRRGKKLLEDSIERVLEVVKTDVLGDDESDSIEGNFEGLEENSTIPVGFPIPRVLAWNGIEGNC